jgi:hypothetical protein
MSEYIEIEAELDEDGEIHFSTNLQLTARGYPEVYGSVAEMEEGSPVAQALAVVVGIVTLSLDGGRLTITSQPEADWHAIITDVKAALTEFFL